MAPDKLARAIILTFGFGAIVIGILIPFGILRSPIPGNIVLIGIGGVVSGLQLVRFALTYHRPSEPTA